MVLLLSPTNAVSYSGALYNGQICGGATELHTCLWRSLDGGATWTQLSVLADAHPGAAEVCNRLARLRSPESAKTAGKKASSAP